MKSLELYILYIVILAFALIVTTLLLPYSNIIFAQIKNDTSNQTETNEILSDNSKLLTSNYSPNQINEIIYHLYWEIQNSNFTELGRSHDIAILIDFICSNESIENAVEACDVVSELPLDD